MTFNFNKLKNKIDSIMQKTDRQMVENIQYVIINITNELLNNHLICHDTYISYWNKCNTYLKIRNFDDKNITRVSNYSAKNHYHTTFQTYSCPAHYSFVKVRDVLSATHDNLNITEFIMPQHFICDNYRLNYVLLYLKTTISLMSAYLPNNVKLDLDIAQSKLFSIVTLIIYQTDTPFLYKTGYQGNYGTYNHYFNDNDPEKYSAIKNIVLVKNMAYDEKKKMYIYPLEFLRKSTKLLTTTPNALLDAQHLFSAEVNFDILQKRKKPCINAENELQTYELDTPYHHKYEQVDIADAYKEDLEFKKYLEKLI